MPDDDTPVIAAAINGTSVRIYVNTSNYSGQALTIDFNLERKPNIASDGSLYALHAGSVLLKAANNYSVIYNAPSDWPGINSITYTGSLDIVTVGW